MLTIDTHCHASPTWFEPVELLVFQMDRNQVDKAVLIQHRGQYDNRYVLECMKGFPDRFVAVGVVDTTLPDAPETLAHWAAEGIQGVRFNPMERSPGNDPLAIWRRAAELGRVASCLGTGEEYASEDFRRLIEDLPDLSVIVEHLGYVGRDDDTSYTYYKKILALARYPNTYMKVPGLGEIMPRPLPARDPTFDINEVPPVIDMAIDAFGAGRLMLGTDYPPCSNREGYANVVRFVCEYLSRRSTSEQEAILSGGAASFFSFKDG